MHTHKLSLVGLPIDMVFVIISLLVNLLFIIISRHIIANDRKLFDVILYYLNMIFFTFIALRANEGIYLENDIPSDIFTILALLFIVLDYFNYTIFDNYSFIVMLSIFILIIFISMSIDENSYSIALGFITFIFSITDIQVFERLFDVNEGKLSPSKLLNYKFLSIVCLLVVFIVMNISKFILNIYFNFAGISLEELPLTKLIKYGSYRFLAFSIIFSTALYYMNSIKKMIGKFLSNNFSK